MSNRYNFADALNFYLYGGKPVIDPAALTELDTTAITVPFNKNGGRSRNQKFRDVLKLWAAMEDISAVYAILGVENETTINYAEPVKVMVYDAIQYSKQVEEILAGYKAAKKRGQKGTFLYGLHKGDKIKPVITLVIHFGEKKWDGPLDLYSMLDLQDAALKRFIPNYRLNLISPSRMKQGDFSKFSTNLGGILKYIKYCGDMKLLEQHAPELPLFEPDEAALINLITKSDLQYEVKEGKVDMCEAIKQMRQNERSIGRNEGLTEGRTEGRTEGLMEGMLLTLAGLVKDNILTPADAAKRANMPVEEFCEKTGLKAVLN